jgi:hypothetical protein
VKPDLADDTVEVAPDGKIKPVLDNICDTKLGVTKYGNKCKANVDDGAKIDPDTGTVKPDLGDNTEIGTDGKIKPKPDFTPCDKLKGCDCTSSPCENGGLCSKTATGYACVCPKSYAGMDCQVPLKDADITPVIPPLVLDVDDEFNEPGGLMCVGYKTWKLKTNPKCLMDQEKCAFDPGDTDSLVTGITAPIGKVIKQLAKTQLDFEIVLVTKNGGGSMTTKAAINYIQLEGATGAYDIKGMVSDIADNGTYIRIKFAVYAIDDIKYKGVSLRIDVKDGKMVGPKGTKLYFSSDEFNSKVVASITFEGAILLANE